MNEPVRQASLDVTQPPDLHEQITELERELVMRKAMYPKWIAEERIKLQTANYRIECLKRAIETLQRHA